MVKKLKKLHGTDTLRNSCAPVLLFPNMQMRVVNHISSEIQDCFLTVVKKICIHQPIFKVRLC